MSRAYYNEFDPKAAAWLRELIKEGHIAPGDVDERSITEVTSSDLTPYAQCHFFAGIGGWSYALRLAGVPDSAAIWTGSCPCQPFSAAGKQLGTADERHLWPVFRDLVRECRPAIVFGEQVASKAGREWYYAGVRPDLEAMAYASGCADLCAASVGAPHIRQRLWWLAYAKDANRRSEQQPRGARCGRCRFTRSCEACRLANPNGAGSQQGRQAASPDRHGRSALADGGAGRLEHSTSDGREQRRAEPDGRRASGGCGAWDSFDILPFRDGKFRRVESGTFPLAHGIPGRVGLLRGYSNAIVPQVAAEFIQAALEAIA